MFITILLATKCRVPRKSVLIDLFAALSLCAGYLLIVTQNPYDLITDLLTAAALLCTLSILRGDRTIRNTKINAAMQFTADYSYTLYLIHMPIIIFVHACFAGASGLTVVASGFLTSNALSALVA